MYSAIACSDLAKHVEARVHATAGLPLIARVHVSPRATDLAIALPSGLFIVIRCVSELTRQDYADLATMLAEGDFVEAHLVYGPAPQPHLQDSIPSWPLDQADVMAASLHRGAAP